MLRDFVTSDGCDALHITVKADRNAAMCSLSKAGLAVPRSLPISYTNSREINC